MEINANCPLAGELARRLRDQREELTRRWLDRIAARVDLPVNEVFPTDELLDHVPLLMDRIADYLNDPADEITADAPVMGKAIELGELRYQQGFDAHQILKEYELLGGVLFAFLAREAEAVPGPCSRGELLSCAHRLFRAVTVIQQITTGHYLRLAAERVNEREQRLRGFNRMVSHELKNRIGAVLGAAQLLEEPQIAGDAAQRDRFVQMVRKNAEGMQGVLEDLLELSRMDVTARRSQHVPLAAVVWEVVRQLREMAAAREVRVEVDSTLPEVEVNAAAMELCLTNYLSNAIKYADPGREDRQVRVRAWVAEGAGAELRVAVEDNGLGVPPESRAALFERFYRAHQETVTGVEGTGLGLSIVRDTAESMGGRAWGEWDLPSGSRFLVAVPLRRIGERGGG